MNSKRMVSKGVSSHPVNINQSIQFNLSLVISFAYLGPPLNNKGAADDAVKLNFMEVKRQLVVSNPTKMT